MSKIIYISRRCEHCHELLIKLHKNKEILKFQVVDVDTTAYPTNVKSVPCMVIGDKVLPGQELFKYLDYLINEKKEKNLPGEPTQKMNSNNKPDNNSQLSNSDLDGGPLDNDDGPNGFCFGDMCDLSYSPLDEGQSISQDNYEYLNKVEDNPSDNKVQSDTRKEKSAQMDTDYERMMESRKLQQPELRPR